MILGQQPIIACPYCSSEALLRAATFVYGPHTPYDGFYWVCSNWPECDAYVGTHDGTYMPFGKLANKSLRVLRREAHNLFDPIWQGGGKLSRSDAYAELAKRMGQPEVHMGEADEDQVQEIIKVLIAWRAELAGYAGRFL